MTEGDYGSVRRTNDHSNGSQTRSCLPLGLAGSVDRLECPGDADFPLHYMDGSLSVGTDSTCSGANVSTPRPSSSESSPATSLTAGI